MKRLLALTSLVVTGCLGAPPVGEAEYGLTARKGVDYSFARPSPTGLHGEGWSFAARYVSDCGCSKNVTKGEADALIAAGVDVVLVWENNGTEAGQAGSYNVGVGHAQRAQAQAAAVGMPASRPIYFAVDYDAGPGDQANINAYLDGAASVLGGAHRVGLYAGIGPISRAFDAGKIGYGWQTYAWSGGNWDNRAQLRQTHNGITAAGDANCCDEDHNNADDFGQWGVTTGASDWAAHYISQTWPLASMAMTLRCGEDIAAAIVMRNDGTKSWDGNTRLGTTGTDKIMRDEASPFAAADWIGHNRAAAIQGSVAPGAHGEFKFNFHGPTGAACVPGDYHQHFGIVQEGVAWFSDAGQGGPADANIEAWIHLVPGNAPPAEDMAGATTPDGGTDDGGSGGAGGGGGSARPKAATGACSFGGSNAPAPFGLLTLLLLTLLVRRVMTVVSVRKQ